MLKKVLLVLAVLVVAFVILVATRPDRYHVERTGTIAVPAEAVFGAVSDFRLFSEWSPWDKRDPNMKKTFSSNPAGVGATYSWEGNKEVGKGRMTITESVPPTLVRQRLEFLEP